MGTTFKVGRREYPLPDFETITFKEARAVKAATGMRMGELPAAFEAGDTDAYLALFVVAKMRVDGPFDPSDLDDLQITALEVSDDEPEVAAGPLAPENAAKPSKPRKTTAAA
jgi:hypothetical protein